MLVKPFFCKCLARFCMPVPHATEQGVHDVQGARVQSLSQDMVLQASVSSCVLHAMPPFFGLTKFERVFERTPPSQSAEHLVHLTWLHFFVRDRAGHLKPHSSGGATTTLRKMSCQPPHSQTTERFGTAGHLSSQLTVHLLQNQLSTPTT